MTDWNTLRWMPHTLVRFAVVMLLCVWSVAASAQDNGGAPSEATSFQIEHFEPLPSQGTNILNVGKSDVLGHLAPSAGLFFHYVDSPIRVVNRNDEDEVLSRPIANQLKAEVWGSIGLFDVAELGFVLPTVLFQSGDELDFFNRNESIDPFALADLRIIPKVRLPIEPEKLGGLGVALAVPVYVPIGDTQSFNSDGEIRAEPRLIVDWRHPVGLAISANVGYQLRPETTASNIVTDDVLRYGVGFEAPTGLENFQIIGSFFGNVPTAGDLSSELQNRSNPMEALGGLQFKLPANFVLNAGAGAGLSSGVGSPRFRAFASIGYVPRGPKDRDGDGVLDADDGCPDDPEDKDGFEDADGCPDLDNDTDGVLDTEDGCPDTPEDEDGFEDEDGCPDKDNDQDGILDTEDKCPDTPGVAEKQGCPLNDKDADGIEDAQDLCPEQPEDKDGFEDDDGCPDPDNDQDGVLDENDGCPQDPEDKDGFEDADGCPDPDNDEDGIPDTEDKCPNEAETYNGNKDDDGCPDGKQTVVITKTDIKILQKVYFESGKDTIQSRSYRLLDTVATVLNKNPQVTKVRVEGHTDDVGDEEDNLDLSRRRAAAVRNYLIEKGVDAERLESEGYGESKPLCTRMDELLENRRRNRRDIKECRADNRRVEFKILEVNGEPVKADSTITIEEKKVIEEPVEQ